MYNIYTYICVPCLEKTLLHHLSLQDLRASDSAFFFWLSEIYCCHLDMSVQTGNHSKTGLRNCWFKN